MNYDFILMHIKMAPLGAQESNLHSHKFLLRLNLQMIVILYSTKDGIEKMSNAQKSTRDGFTKRKIGPGCKLAFLLFCLYTLYKMIAILRH